MPSIRDEHLHQKHRCRNENRINRPVFRIKFFRHRLFAILLSNKIDQKSIKLAVKPKHLAIQFSHLYSLFVELYRYCRFSCRFYFLLHFIFSFVLGWKVILTSAVVHAITFSSANANWWPVPVHRSTFDGTAVSKYKRPQIFLSLQCDRVFHMKRTVGSRLARNMLATMRFPIISNQSIRRLPAAN